MSTPIANRFFRQTGALSLRRTGYNAVRDEALDNETLEKQREPFAGTDLLPLLPEKINAVLEAGWQVYSDAELHNKFGFV
ncbi:MAG: hypothetical protein WA957_06235, partial [Alteraurantiacibacter sp.]